jgi:hypothetical protein
MEQARALPLDIDAAAGARHGLRTVLGTAAWERLPAAVRERFAETAGAADYAGSFETVRASPVGRLFAWVGTLVGTPVAPRTGRDVEARVRVRPGAAGVEWIREYFWDGDTVDRVHSTKVVTAAGQLVEVLPARLCMPLHTYVEGAVLHFVSLGYYFDLGLGLKLWLPALLTPGVTHVEHVDLGRGWFRFTMTVTHPWLGEMFFQTGRFCATEEAA